jgi:hypothetical protein
MQLRRLRQLRQFGQLRRLQAEEIVEKWKIYSGT